MVSSSAARTGGSDRVDGRLPRTALEHRLRKIADRLRRRELLELDQQRNQRHDRVLTTRVHTCHRRESAEHRRKVGARVAQHMSMNCLNDQFQFVPQRIVLVHRRCLLADLRDHR
jgi:hypothetical protein